MSPEGAFPRAADRDFGLIETFRWAPEEGYTLLAEHLARLDRSAAALGFAFHAGRVEERLRADAGAREGAPSRVRLVLARDGTMTMSASPLGQPATAYRVAIAPTRHASTDPWLRHKTTLRDRYEHPLAAAASNGADEVLFLNEHGALCEGARSNLFVRRDGRLLTPPLACGLLPGTLRAHLLHTGEAQEAALRLDDLAAADWFLGNAVRGLVPSTLVSSPSGSLASLGQTTDMA